MAASATVADNDWKRMTQDPHLVLDAKLKLVL
jgi:hypothetical protein